MQTHSVFQFKITLQETNPAIWRRIQISDKCTFWDFHVAIQDAMGWNDSHLHEFLLISPDTYSKISIGMSWSNHNNSEEMDDMPEGCDLLVRDYLQLEANKTMCYRYDFGDCWEHLIEFEGRYEDAVQSPVCLAGERSCPPDDVGGISGFDNFLSAMEDSKHAQHQEFLEWLGGKYDPQQFDPKKVKFDNPKSRLECIYADMERLKF